MNDNLVITCAAVFVIIALLPVVSFSLVLHLYVFTGWPRVDVWLREFARRIRGSE